MVIIMKNKVLVELIVPQIDQSFNLYIPINKKVGNVILLLNKAISDLTNGIYVGSNRSFLYDSITGDKYNINDLVIKTNRRNGSVLVLM